MELALTSLMNGMDLSPAQSRAAMTAIADGHAHPAQVGALVSLLARKGETSGEIMGFADILRQRAIRVEVGRPVLDIVGTGGDGHNSVNISTSAAFVAAACGAIVAKHGSTSVSSKSGSSDVLQKLGVALLPPNKIRKCIDSVGMAFLFAPHFHPAMKNVLDVRRALKFRTVFNILGPLLNPCGATRLLLGVYSKELLDKYAQAVYELGAEHALIVNCQGMDELAAVGPTDAREVTREHGVKELVIEPLDFGIERCTVKDLEGGDSGTNASIVRKVFSSHDLAIGPIGKTIALNAGAALYVYGIADTIKCGYDMALEKIKSGDMIEFLEKVASVSTELGNKADEE